THDELITAKIVTSIVDSDQFGLSGINDWRHPELEQILLSIPLCALARAHNTKAFKKLVMRLLEGVKLGNSVLEITNDAQGVLMSEILQKYLRVAPDGVIQRYWSTQLAEMDQLRKVDPALCVAYAFPELEQLLQSQTACSRGAP